MNLILSSQPKLNRGISRLKSSMGGMEKVSFRSGDLSSLRLFFDESDGF